METIFGETKHETASSNQATNTNNKLNDLETTNTKNMTGEYVALNHNNKLITRQLGFASRFKC